MHQLLWEAMWGNGQWISYGPRCRYLIQRRSNLVSEYTIHCLSRVRRRWRMGRYLPQVAATLDEAIALAQADHDALEAKRKAA